MDKNVFEILIALYFIFAFIGGILKKKKKEREKGIKQANIPDGDSVNHEEVKAERRRETEEMLNKLLGVQLPQSRVEEADEEEITDKFIRQENIEDLPTWNPEDDFKEEKEFQGFAHEKSSDPLAEKYTPKTETSEFKKPALLEDIDFGDSSYVQENQTSFSRELIKKLKEPATLKEAILLSEIISKPKALRRNG